VSGLLRVSARYGWCRRAAIGLAVAVAVCVPAGPAAAEPISVPLVKFVGTGDEQAVIVAPAGDVNGDGDADVIIGAPSAQTGPGQYGGVAYVVFGPFVAGTTIDLRDVGSRGLVLRGAGGRSAGTSVAGAGDVNGDGLADLLVGAPGEQGWPEQSSWAYVVFGRRGPGTIELSTLGRAGITLRGKRHETLPDHFGAQVAPLGDINHDGLADVGILASGEATASHKRPNFRPGSAYVVFGRRWGGSLSMAKLGRAGFRVGFARHMYGISTAGDWNADGRPDVALSGGGRRGAGFGSSMGTATAAQSSSRDSARRAR
jgi:FG-GAP repeat